MKDELMEHLKAGLNLPEGEEMPAEDIKKQANTYYGDLQYYVVRDMILE